MIGEAWNITDDPAKPWALFDTDAQIAIPIGLAGWLDSLGATYGSHDVVIADPLECVSEGALGSDEAGTVLLQIRVRSGATYSKGTKYPFTVRVFGADGFTKDDRTFWLKLVDR